MYEPSDVGEHAASRQGELGPDERQHCGRHEQKYSQSFSPNVLTPCTDKRRMFLEGTSERDEIMTTTTSTRIHSHHGAHCSHAAHGLTERGALGYLYWPLAAASIFTIAQSQIMATTISAWLGF